MAIESSLKLLEYLIKVSKEPITVNGELLCSKPVERVHLNWTFFIKDDCQMCGRCCINETNAWTFEGLCRIGESVKEDYEVWGLDYSDNNNLLERLEEVPVKINGKWRTFYISPKDSEKDAFTLGWNDREPRTRCHWLFEKDGTYRCRIHPVRSVTCGMPHCRFFYNALSNTCSIGVSQYGRNWALKCPVNLSSIKVDVEGVESRKLWLTRLNDVADDLGINTYLPEILKYLDSGKFHEATFEFNQRPSLFVKGGLR